MRAKSFNSEQFLNTPTYKKTPQKKPPRIEPWWPSFYGLNRFLNSSINKKPFFVSSIVRGEWLDEVSCYKY